MNRDEFLKILPAYMGCRIVATRLHSGKTLTRLRLNNIAEMTGQKYSDLKLILRSLDQMTDEEQEFALNIARSYWESDKTLAGNSAERRIQVCAREINYLRSIGIDCDGLIEADYAIKKEIE